MRSRPLGLASLVVPLTLLLLGATPAAQAAAPDWRIDPPVAQVTTAPPLSGVRIALDPGHQLGNRHFPAQTGRLVPAGGFRKPCNTTGTATRSGYPEATFNFQVARAVARRLRALGAEVVFTRSRNSESLWGPCVDERGRFGARMHADLMVSLHADGGPSSARGFHVIAPRPRVPWSSVGIDSFRLAESLRAGLDARRLPRADYLAGGYGLVRRHDLATLNLSGVPVALVELGNMRNSADAARMTSPIGRATYAAAVVQGIRRYVNGRRSGRGAVDVGRLGRPVGSPDRRR